MKNGVKILAIALVLALVGITMAMATGAREAAEERPSTLRMGLMETEGTASAMAAQRLAELVEQYTDGRYSVDVFPGAALGETGDAIESVMDGGIQLWWNGISWYENFADDFRIFSLNWAFDDNDHLLRFFETDRFQVDMKDQLRALNLEMIGYQAFRNPRNVLSRVPIRGNEDLDGLLIRTPPQPMYVRSWAATGANPTQMDYGEVYTALRTGAIEAMENPVDAAHGMSFQEVAKYYAETRHLLNPYATVMNRDLWESLSDADQEAFLRAAREAGEYHTAIVDEMENEIREIWTNEHGVTFVEMNIPELAEKVRPLALEMEERGEWAPGLFDYVRSLSAAGR